MSSEAKAKVEESAETPTKDAKSPTPAPVAESKKTTTNTSKESEPEAEAESSDKRRRDGDKSTAEGTKADDGADDEPRFDATKLPPAPKDPEGTIDMDTFSQIREMDDEDDDTFSRGIVFGFFEQAEHTFDQMGKAIREENVGELSSLGHFLKGSSAALGVVKVQEICENIQHFGKLRDEKAGEDIKKDDALKRIKESLGVAKEEYLVAKAWFTKMYADLAAAAE